MQVESTPWEGGYRRRFLGAYGPFPHSCHFCGEPVRPPDGKRDALSAVIHHVDLDSRNHSPSNLAAAHQGCHAKYHLSLRADAPRPERRVDYRRIFVAARGAWPHRCYFCQAEVDGHTQPFDRTAAVIHHLNGDRSDNEIGNLAPAHHGCHMAYHASSRTPEHRARLGASRKGRKASPELRAKLSAAHKGKPLSPSHAAAITAALRTPEARAKSREAHKGQTFTPEARAKARAAIIGKPRSPEVREKIRKANTGKKHSPEAREKIRLRNIGRVQSAETRRKISEAGKGRSHSQEARKAIARTLTGVPHQRVCCLRCRREIGGRMVSRHRCVPHNEMV